MKRYKVVEVEWVDSTRKGGWAPQEEYDKIEEAQCRSSGYLLHSNRHFIKLIQSIDVGNSGMTDSITIPRCAVRKVTQLVYKTAEDRRKEH